MAGNSFGIRSVLSRVADSNVGEKAESSIIIIMKINNNNNGREEERKKKKKKKNGKENSFNELFGVSWLGGGPVSFDVHPCESVLTQTCLGL